MGRRFAREGYHAVLCRRSDQEGLDKLVEEIESEGGSASGFLLNAVEADSIEECGASAEAEIGPIEVVIFNLGAQIGDRALRDTSYKAFEMGWRLATFGLFRVASAARLLPPGNHYTSRPRARRPPRAVRGRGNFGCRPAGANPGRRTKMRTDGAVAR